MKQEILSWDEEMNRMTNATFFSLIAQSFNFNYSEMLVFDCLSNLGYWYLKYKLKEIPF